MLDKQEEKQHNNRSYNSCFKALPILFKKNKSTEVREEMMKKRIISVIVVALLVMTMFSGVVFAEDITDFGWTDGWRAKYESPMLGIGEEVTLSVPTDEIVYSGNLGDLNYQWYHVDYNRDTGSVDNYEIIPGETGTSLSVATGWDSLLSYCCTITSPDQGEIWYYVTPNYNTGLRFELPNNLEEPDIYEEIKYIDSISENDTISIECPAVMNDAMMVGASEYCPITYLWGSYTYNEEEGYYEIDSWWDAASQSWVDDADLESYPSAENVTSISVPQTPGYYTCYIDDGYQGLEYCVEVKQHPIVCERRENVYVARGQDATLSVEASSLEGRELSYTWRKYATDEVLSTDSTLTLPAIEASDYGWYYCTVSDGTVEVNIERFLLPDTQPHFVSLKQETKPCSEIVITGTVASDKFQYTFDGAEYWTRGLEVAPFSEFYDENGNCFAADQDGDFSEDGWLCYFEDPFNPNGVRTAHGFGKVTYREDEDHYYADLEVTIDISDGCFLEENRKLFIEGWTEGPDLVYEIEVPAFTHTFGAGVYNEQTGIETFTCKHCTQTINVTQGARNTWKFGDQNGLTVKSDYDFDKFTGITVDGRSVAPANYTAKAGSTIVTLNPEYLGTLTVGEHTLGFEYTDAVIETSFNVTATSAPAQGDPSSANGGAESGGVKTGDDGMLMLWVLAALGAAVLTVFAVKKRKA